MNPALALLETDRASRVQMISELEARLKDERATLRQIEEGIRLLESALGQAQAAPAASSAHVVRGLTNDRKLKDMVLDIIRGARNGLTTMDITAALDNAGRPTDQNSVLSTLSRMKREEVIVKHDKRWHAVEKSEAPDAATSRASTDYGHEAELEDMPVAQHPTANRESVGSSPTVSAPFRRDLLSSTSAGPMFTTPKPPFAR